jgi:methylglutaconyl-CoA hydratase
MLSDLLDIFERIREEAPLRAVVLTGEGKAFCAGADLNWMRRVAGYTFQENYQDSLALAQMLRAIHECPKPVVCAVNGAAIGGGTGLVGACDIAVASADAVFAFTETKLGLTPAVISPYLLKKMGEGNLRRYFLTGERFSAEQARQVGLIQEVAPAGELEERVDAIVSSIISGGPQALTVTKELIRGICERGVDENGPYTAEVIARLRSSEEGQEGMKAFLEKRKPSWVMKD